MVVKRRSTRKPTRPLRRRGGPRRRLVRRRMVRNVPEYASCSVRRSLNSVNSNGLFYFNSIQLADFQRAVAVAQAYQKFRMTGVTLTIKPNQDAFTSVAAGAPQKAYLYFMLDKAATIPNNVTLESLKQMGAKPHQLDEKPFKITWKPAVLVDTATSGLSAAANKYQVSPWLSTSNNPLTGVFTANSTDHQGIKLYIEQVGATTLFAVDIEVQFQFVKPFFGAVQGPQGSSMEYATMDASPDGIEGGSDGITIPIEDRPPPPV